MNFYSPTYLIASFYIKNMNTYYHYVNNKKYYFTFQTCIGNMNLNFSEN